MALSTVPLCTREDVKGALDFAETARSDVRVDRALESATLSVTGRLHRSFVPTIDARSWNYPDGQHGTPWRLWLDQHELISVTTVTSGGVTIPAADYFLEPNGSGPPYSSIEIDLGSSSAFASSSGTWQQAIAVLGLFGHSDDQVPVGTLSASLSDTTGTVVAVSDGSQVGVGSLLKVDTERMLVTGRAMSTTSQTGSLTASSADQILTPSGSVATFHVGELLLIDAERLLIVDITTTALIVKRAFDGSTLAAHTAATIYASRSLTVVRGASGSTAATHSNGATVTAWAPPPLVRSLAVAETINEVLQQSAGYARTAGQGDDERQMRLDALGDIRAQAYVQYGRKVRMRVVAP
jgi:hypothetical protein